MIEPLNGTIGRSAAGISRSAAVADRIIPPTDPVDRDPCQRCGVRRDFGCHHSRQQLGMVFA